MRKVFNILLVLLLFICFSGFSQNFNTHENGIRNLITAEIDGESILYISELDGGVSCYTIKGEKKWSRSTKKAAIVFKLAATDIDGDGNDDLLVASADGSIYCWGSNGNLLWNYRPEPKMMFTDLAVLKDGVNSRIYAGGNNCKLYELDANGQLLSTTDINGVVRSMEVGNFIDSDKPSLFLMTYTHDKFRWRFMGYLNPYTKKVQKEYDYKKDASSKLFSRLMITDISVADINKDKRDDILLFGERGSPVFVAFDGNFNEIAKYEGDRKDRQRYSHTQGVSLIPVRDEIAMQYGGFLYALTPEGKLIRKSGERYGSFIFNQLALDVKSKQLIGAGQVGGDNSLYFYPLNRNWTDVKQVSQGRIAEVETNLKKLYKQILNFTPPSYQTIGNKPWVMITSVKPNSKLNKLKAADIQFVDQIEMQESTDRAYLVDAIGPTALKKDRRKKYNMSHEEIVELARKREAKRQPFTAWAGHGNDPFILQLPTLLKVLEVAPTTCYGFIYAEMHNIEDPRVQYFIDHYVPALAEAMRKNGRAKMYFRFKNMFWATTSHIGPWKKMFFSSKYSDVLVPASEDTSSRTQDINLSGRVGMFAAGYVDDYAMRLVDDNPTSWRPYTPGGQKSLSPYLRQGVMMAAYGARYGIMFKNNYLEEPGYNILYALMKSGVLPMTNKDNIVSIGAWHLIQDVDEVLIGTVDDHHNMEQYSEDDIDAVISSAQMHWAGADVPDYDYSKVALGIDYRWMNYLPVLPHGMVPIAPIEYAGELQKINVPYTVSDARVGIVDGEKLGAKLFGEVLKSSVEKGANEMPVIVEGAAWVAIRLDDTHIRVILMDQGYITPQERKVKIMFQGESAVGVVDILSNEKLEIFNDMVSLTVPAGSLRFIDVTY